MREKKQEANPAVWTTEEFEYTFSEKVRDEIIQIKDIYQLVKKALTGFFQAGFDLLGRSEFGRHNPWGARPRGFTPAPGGRLALPGCATNCILL